MVRGSMFIVNIPVQFQPRTVAVRKSSGHFVAEPQTIYDRLCSGLGDRQVGIEDLFWLEDEKLSLD